MTTVAAELKVTEFVRFFDAGGPIVVPTNGKTIQELAERARHSGVYALETFKVIRGEVPLPGQAAVPVKSEEFDCSSRHYINGEVFPIAEVPEGEKLLSPVHRPQFGVKTRFGTWELEREKPEVVTIS